MIWPPWLLDIHKSPIHSSTCTWQMAMRFKIFDSCNEVLTLREMDHIRDKGLHEMGDSFVDDMKNL